MNAFPSPHFSFSGPEPLGLDNLIDIGISLGFLKEDMSLLGLGVRLNLVGDDQRNFGDVIDPVALSHDEGRDTGSGNSGDHGVALLGYVDLAVPTAVGLGGGEHVTATAHVSESTLTGAVSTTTPDAWNTGNGTTSTPGLGTGLVT